MKNLILVVFDCLRADFCFPDGPPFIEHLKEQGEAYSQYISVATSTVPCFASMLTGLYPETHGIKGHPRVRKDITDTDWCLKKDVVTLPMMLKNHGYHTYAEVSDPLITQFKLNRDFDHYHVRDQKTSTFTPKYFEDLKQLVEGFQEPYFFLLHLFELHRGPSRDKFKKQCEHLEQLLADRQKNTIFAVTGDHGETMGKGVRHGHHIQEHLVRIPLIIAGEGVDHRVILDQYSQVDLLPLLLIKFNISASLPYKLPGDIQPRKHAYMRAVGAPLQEKSWMVGIRTETHKYITHPFNKVAKDELYQLPEETLLNIEEHKGIASVLSEELREIMKMAEDLGLGEGKEWTEEDDRIIQEKLRELGYLE